VSSLATKKTMSVEREIKKLLLKNECVTVPGFGAFITHYAPAQIFPAQNKLLPPSKTISFNRLLINNDGLLISSYSIQEAIGYQEAARTIEKQVNHWNRALENQQAIILEDIGKLIKTNDGKIDFIEGLTENISLQSYGLKTLYHLPINRSISAEKNIVLPTSIPSTTAKIQQQKRKRRASYRRNNAKYLLAGCVLAIIGLSQLLLFTDSPIQVSEANFINFNFVESAPAHLTEPKKARNYLAISAIDNSLLPRESYAKPFKKIAQEPITTATSVSKVEQVVAQEAQPLPTGYYIILGCFKEQKNANKLCQKLMKEGKKIYKKTSNSGFTTIGEFVSSSQEESMKILKSRQVTQPDIWLKKL
jgi:cell division septation protein DedD